MAYGKRECIWLRPRRLRKNLTPYEWEKSWKEYFIMNGRGWLTTFMQEAIAIRRQYGEYFTSGKVTAGNNHITRIESTLRIDCIASVRLCTDRHSSFYIATRRCQCTLRVKETCRQMEPRCETRQKWKHLLCFFFLLISFIDLDSRWNLLSSSAGTAHRHTNMDAIERSKQTGIKRIDGKY